MRWDYKVPEPKVFVSDGRRMYLHVPADNQVMVSPVPEQDQATTAVLFLVGKGNLARDFTVSYGEGGGADTYVLKLQPKLAERDYDWLQLEVDRRTLQIRSLSAADARAAVRPSGSRISRKTPDWPIRHSSSRFPAEPMSPAVALPRVERIGSRSVSEKSLHAPSRPASPADCSNDLARDPQVPRLLGVRQALLGRTPSAAIALAASLLLTGCAAATTLGAGERAERARNYDLAVVEYTKAVRANPDDRTARLSLDRARMRASQEHYFRGRRLADAERYEDALVEFQLASQLNPMSADVDAALRDARQKVRTKLAVSREGKTELQALIDRSRDLVSPGLELPTGVKLPDSLVFSNASSRMVFMALGRFAGINLVFDPGFREAPISIDLRNASLEDALTSVTASTHTFYRVTARNTITIIPDSASKRREYEESIVRTFYLSNADIKEVIDLLRVVVDVRQISPITATNAIALKDTPERIAAAGRIIAAVDKARPEVVIDVELLEVDRFRLREYGLELATPGEIPGVVGSITVTPADQTLQSLRSLTQANIALSGLPGIFYRLLKNDSNTRTLANPNLRTSEGLTAQARFGEKVPVPVTTFAPIAAGRHQSAAVHVVRIREHRRQHRHHAAYPSRRRNHSGAEGRGEQHVRRRDSAACRRSATGRSRRRFV